MICASCHAPTDSEPCACGASPVLVGEQDRYRLLEPLGRGGSGTTWRAERLADGGVVAIKEMALGTADTKARELVAREAAVLRQLDHPQIPRWFEDFVGGTGKARSLYLVQSYVAGHDLRQELVDHRYDEAEVLVVLAEVCGILTYLHNRSPPIVHRDLKPANLRRRADGSLVLLDFGSVREALRDPDLGGSTVAGTFGYMAPEQFAGDASPRTDLYGLGALAIALLSRQDPAKLLTPGAHRWEPVLDVSPATKALLRTLLAVNPADRPASAAAVAQRLAQRSTEAAVVRPPATGRPSRLCLRVSPTHSRTSPSSALMPRTSTSP